MTAEKANIDLKESGQNLFLLVFTLSLFSFFIFNENGALAFAITFLSSLIILVSFQYFRFKNTSKNETFVKETKLKDHNYKFENLAARIEDIETNETYKKMSVTKLPPLHKKPQHWVKSSGTINPARQKRMLPIYKKHVTMGSYGSETLRGLYNPFQDEYLLTSVLSEFGEILDSDNRSQPNTFTDTDRNSLILQMEVCIRVIRINSNNPFAKEESIKTLRNAINYLKQKDLISNIGLGSSDIPNFK